MICFKSTVRVHVDTIDNPSMWRILSVVQACAPVGYDITVTSACDSAHKEGSKHYLGKAFDFRTRDFPADASLQTWLRRVSHTLGVGYYAQLEGDHLHVQSNG